MTSTTPTPEDQPIDDAGPATNARPATDAVPADAGPATDAGPADRTPEPDGGAPSASPAEATPIDVPSAAEDGLVPQVDAGRPGAGWRARLTTHPVATGAVAATLAAGLAFGGGVLVGQATASPGTSGWTDRSGLPGAPPNGTVGGGRGRLDPRVAPRAPHGPGGTGGTTGTDT